MNSKVGQLATVSGPARLEVVQGDSKGQVFELASTHLSIGRSSNNEIVLNAEGVSRNHATIAQSEGGWFIRDNGSKNGVFLNGEKVAESWLQTGDIVQIGTLSFRFDGAEEAADPQALAQDVPMLEMAAASDGKKPKKAPNRRVLIYGGVGLLLVGLYFMQDQAPESGEKAKDAVSAAANKLAADFKLSPEPNLDVSKVGGITLGLEDPVLKRAEQEMEKLDWTNSTLRESEQFFKKGQREYLSKNYHRAIEFFQNSLSLYRGHLLAERYLRRAVYEAEILAKAHRDSGVRYFESLQYQRAMYHFSEVITLMAHRPSEPIVAEAERYIQMCRRRLQAGELFP